MRRLRRLHWVFRPESGQRHVHVQRMWGRLDRLKPPLASSLFEMTRLRR